MLACCQSVAAQPAEPAEPAEPARRSGNPEYQAGGLGREVSLAVAGENWVVTGEEEEEDDPVPRASRSRPVSSQPISPPRQCPCIVLYMLSQQLNVVA